jgi:indole-3-glycerol phosphate synthase
VLTNEPYFQGSLDYLGKIRRSVGVPLLRKDFILDRYQVVEARVAGADAVLLIAECLDDPALKNLHDAILDLGMTPLVELYEPDNLPRVVGLGAKLIGINNRSLRTFEVDLGHTLRLRRRIPDDRIVVGESGIRTRADAERLERAGVHAMLVGESLMARSDIGSAVDALIGGTGTRRGGTGPGPTVGPTKIG